VRVLLDECVPRKLRAELAEHEVHTVTEIGWSGIKNGALLSRAAEAYDVVVTVDRSIEFQQNLVELPIAVIVIASHSNDISTLRPLMAQVRPLLHQLEPRKLHRVGVA
jgi:hypothetical protein